MSIAYKPLGDVRSGAICNGRVFLTSIHGFNRNGGQTYKKTRAGLRWCTARKRDSCLTDFLPQYLSTTSPTPMKHCLAVILAINVLTLASKTFAEPAEK